MNSEELWSYIKRIEEKSPIDFKLVDINWGDRYYNEQGWEFQFTICGEDYCVGYSYITEDSDDWAQAESYRVTWCRQGDDEVQADKVFHLIENWKRDDREKKLGELL